MENKKILFITFDMSGYYTGVYEELKLRYKWDMEDRTIQKFIELVERRYL